MATQTIEFAAPSGQTITAKLFAAGSDTIEATAGSVTARTNATGVYVATVTSTLAGVYRLVATNPAGTLLAQWWVRLANADGTYIAYETPNADYLDATVSSRLATSGYTTPPTAATNATAVRTELATELGRIDVAVSTRSTFAGGAVASVTAGVTVSTNNDKTGYALIAVTGLGNQTANITGNVSGSVGSVTGAVGSVTGAVGSVTNRVTANTDQWNGVTVTGMPMPTYVQPTGFLAATFPATVSSFAGGAVASVTGNVGGNVVGSVGSISGVTFPSNFAALGINASGHVSRVVLVDTTTANSDMRGTDDALLAASYTAPLNTAGTAAAVWNSLLTTYTTAGSFGARVVRSTDSNSSLQITGSNHAAAVLHDAEPDSIPADALAAATITAIQAGLATTANQTIIIDRVTFALTALVGACSDAQTAEETYTLTIGGSTFTVDYSGLDSSGNRSTTTLSKA